MGQVVNPNARVFAVAFSPEGDQRTDVIQRPTSFDESVAVRRSAIEDTFGNQRVAAEADKPAVAKTTPKPNNGMDL